MKIAAGIQSSGEAANRSKFSTSSHTLQGYVSAQLKSVYQQAQ